MLRRGRAALPLAGGAAPACQPVRTLQAGEESIAKLLTTIPTQPGGKRRGFMGRYGLGLVLLHAMHSLPALKSRENKGCQSPDGQPGLAGKALPSACSSAVETNGNAALRPLSQFGSRHAGCAWF